MKNGDRIKKCLLCIHLKTKESTEHGMYDMCTVGIMPQVFRIWYSKGNTILFFKFKNEILNLF